MHGHGNGPVSNDPAAKVEEFSEALRSLPTRQAQAALFYIDDLPVSQVAEVLGCAPGTVKTHLQAARQRLHRSLSVDTVTMVAQTNPQARASHHGPSALMACARIGSVSHPSTSVQVTALTTSSGRRRSPRP